MFVVKARAREDHLNGDLLRYHYPLAFGKAVKICQEQDKRRCTFVNYGCKMFYNIGLKGQ
jgi:hypothetical protein